MIKSTIVIQLLLLMIPCQDALSEEGLFYSTELYDAGTPEEAKYLFHWTTEEWKAFDFEIVHHYRRQIAYAKYKGLNEIDLKYLVLNNRHFKKNLQAYLQEKAKREKEPNEAGNAPTAPVEPSTVVDLQTAEELIDQHQNRVWNLVTKSDIYTFGRGFYLAANPCSSVFFGQNRSSAKKKDRNNLVIFKFRDKIGKNPIRYFKGYKDKERLQGLVSYLKKFKGGDFQYEFDSKKKTPKDPKAKDLRYLLPNSALVDWLTKNVDIAGYFNDGADARDFLANQYINDDYHVLYNQKFLFQAEVQTLWSEDRQVKNDPFVALLNDFIKATRNDPDMSATLDNINACHMALRDNLPLISELLNF